MSPHDSQLIERLGKHSTWRVADGPADDGARISARWEVRQGDKLIAVFDNEAEALDEMRLQDRIAVQNRPSGPGM